MELERNPLFRLDDIHDLTKDQIRERTMAKLYVSSRHGYLVVKLGADNALASPIAYLARCLLPV
jgi:hypothetical protein